jgi:hypothetical protein
MENVIQVISTYGLNVVGAIKEMVKDGKTLKQSGRAPDWTGNGKKS